MSERTSYSSREDPASRYTPDRFAGSTAYDQSIVQDRNMNYGNRDLRNANRILDKPVVTSPARAQGTAASQNISAERLQDMSMAAIREYYRYCFLFMMFLSPLFQLVRPIVLFFFPET